MTVTITTLGNPVNIASANQTISLNVTNYDTTSAAVAAAVEADAAVAAIAADVVLTHADVVAAEAARDAAIAGAIITWPTTAAGIGSGIAGVTSIVAGSAGTNGTFALAFSGGTQVLAPVGVFTVAGGVLVSVTITYPGYYSAGTPTLSFAASAGLTGASAMAVMAANTPVNGFFAVPSGVSGEAAIIYKNVAGVATEAFRTPSAALVHDVADLLPLFDLATSVNLFDSTTGVDGTGVNASGSTFTGLARYGRIVFSAAPLTQYTVTLAYAPTDWVLNMSAYVNCYNSAALSVGTLVLSLSGGSIAYSDSGRTVTFTTPAATTHVAINAYNAVVPSPSTQQFDDMWSRVMANTGATRSSFVTFDAGLRAFPGDVLNKLGPVQLRRTGTDVYIQHPDWRRAGWAIVRKISLGVTPSATEAGPVDFTGLKFAQPEYGPEFMDITWASGVLVALGNDNGPPVRFNQQYLGGGHGLAASARLTVTGHGLSNVNVGDVGTDGTAKQWVLVGIVDANTIDVVAANTGASVTRWLITGSLGATGTMTFAAAGAKSWTARTSIQLLPLVQSLTQKIYVDGVEVVGDGWWDGQSAEITEVYSIPNPAQWLADLIAARGTSSPKVLSDATNQTQMKISQTWRFDRYGAMTGYSTHQAIQEFNLITTGSYDYIGAWQRQSIFKTSHTLWQYVPGLSGTVSGYDLTATADITSNVSSPTVGVANVANIANPPAHFAQFVKLSGTPVHGLAMGYMTTKAAGVPATRDNLSKFWQLSSSEKQYPVAWDGGQFAGQLVPAGTVMQTAFWDALYHMADFPTHTVDVAYADGSKTYRVIDIHATVTGYAIQMPRDAVGKNVTVLDSTNMTVLSGIVDGSGVLVTTTGGYGRAILELT
jgi:hypothetical protein